jgi:hypothetical protein
VPDNTLYYGDNLDILRRYVADESVDLEPPTSPRGWARGVSSHKRCVGSPGSPGCCSTARRSTRQLSGVIGAEPSLEVLLQAGHCSILQAISLHPQGARVLHAVSNFVLCRAESGYWVRLQILGRYLGH